MSSTINDEFRLKKENQELKDKDDYSKFVIEKRLKEKDEEITKLKTGMKILNDSFKKTVDTLEIVLKVVQKVDQQKQEERKLDREVELETY